MQQDVGCDAAGDGYCQQIPGYTCNYRGILYGSADITDHLFNLVLLLEEFCNDSPAENDDPEC